VTDRDVSFGTTIRQAQDSVVLSLLPRRHLLRIEGRYEGFGLTGPLRSEAEATTAAILGIFGGTLPTPNGGPLQ